MPENSENTAYCGLPKPRGTMTQCFSLGALAVFLIGGFLIVGCLKTFQEAICYATLGPCLIVFVMSVLHNIIRICHLPEELRHIPGRYHNYKAVFKAVFKCNLPTCLSYGASTIVTLGFWIMNENPVEYLHSLGSFPSLIMLGVGVVWCNIIKIEESPLDSSLLLENFELNIGCGMAFSFFYGYLRIVLPDTGDPNKGIKKKIKTYINHNKLQDRNFPVKKLFILIPKNLSVPPTLTDVSDGMMEVANSLEVETLSRSGVKGRVYRNSVYKITSEPEPIYVVAEGASPLKTYEETIRYHRHVRETFHRYRDDIVLSFYRKLKCIIEDEDCEDLCELIYYNDKDERGRKVNVARILLEKIKEIQDTENHERNNGFLM